MKGSTSPKTSFANTLRDMAKRSRLQPEILDALDFDAQSFANTLREGQHVAEDERAARLRHGRTAAWLPRTRSLVHLAMRPELMQSPEGRYRSVLAKLQVLGLSMRGMQGVKGSTSPTTPRPSALASSARSAASGADGDARVRHTSHSQSMRSGDGRAANTAGTADTAAQPTRRTQPTLRRKDMTRAESTQSGFV